MLKIINIRNTSIVNRNNKTEARNKIKLSLNVYYINCDKIIYSSEIASKLPDKPFNAVCQYKSNLRQCTLVTKLPFKRSLDTPTQLLKMFSRRAAIKKHRQHSIAPI